MLSTCDTQSSDHMQPVSNTQVEVEAAHSSSESCVNMVLKRSSGLFLLELKESKGLSQVALDTVVEGCERLVEQCCKKIEQQICMKLQEAPNACDGLPIVKDTFDSYEKPFELLRTKYQQEKYFVEEFNMIVSENVCFLCYTVLSFLVSCFCMGTLPLGTPHDFYELPLI